MLIESDRVRGRDECGLRAADCWVEELDGIGVVDASDLNSGLLGAGMLLARGGWTGFES